MLRLTQSLGQPCEFYLQGLEALFGHAINWAALDRAAVPPVPDPTTQRYVPFEDPGSIELPPAPTAGSVIELVAGLDKCFAQHDPGAAPASDVRASAVPTVEWTHAAEGGDSQALAEVVVEMLAALEGGAVVLSGAVSAEVCNAVEAELRPYGWQAMGISATTGGLVDPSYSDGAAGSVLSRSVAAQAMAAHPALVAVVEGVLGRQVLHPALADQLTASGSRLPWRVHVDTLIPKAPQQPAQQLHRDGDLSLWDCANELDHAVSVIWSLDGDFTNARGTTRVVLGSTDWPYGRIAADAETVGAEMKRGSALIYVGRTYHGAGVNSTGSGRVAMNIAYQSSFLKQECNTFISAPPGLVQQMGMPPLVAELLGYAGGDAKYLSLGAIPEEAAPAARL
jgi:hypothetical protein